MPRVKLLTSDVYSPTNPSSEAAIREQIDGSIQEVYDASAKSGETVILTTDQTIAGVKTFASSPIVPTPTTPTQTANKSYVDGVAISATVPLDSLTDDFLSSAVGQIKPRVATLETNTINFQTDYEYDTTPTIVGQEIQVSKLGPSLIAKFYLNAAVTGGAITISTDAGATSIALKNGAGETVTELEPGLYEVAYVTPFFILRSSGGLGNFFGDGSDGTIPNLNSITSAPNGGTVANLWDMNAGTVFTTGTLSSASDQVIFSIDFGSPQFWVASGGFSQILWSSSISTGASRIIDIEKSSDGISWTSVSSSTSITTTPSNIGAMPNAGVDSKRYWRYVLKAGGSNCTVSIQGATINLASGDTQTTKVWNIVHPSTLNGAAVVKQYTDFSLPVGYGMTVQNPNQGLVIYSQNNITNAGVIDMSQKAGLAPNGNIIPMLITNFKAFDPYGIQKFYELTTKLQVLKGGAGGNGGYGGGYSGATGRQTSVGIGGAGRQNLGGFGGGGSGGSVFATVTGGIGGSISNAEIGGGKLPRNISANTASAFNGVSGINGSGALGQGQSLNVNLYVGATGFAYGGGSGGSGASNASNGSDSIDSQYSGGFLMLIAKNNITNSGTILANGGVGSNGSASAGTNTGGGGGGGGAGGGVIVIAHGGAYSNTGTVQANGGAGGAGGAKNGTGEIGGTGTSGSVGTIANIQL